MKCASGMPDHVGNNLIRMIDLGIMDVHAKVVMHRIIPKHSTTIKKTLVEMVEHCQVIVTVGWVPIKFSNSTTKVFPQWVHEVLYTSARNPVFVVPQRLLIVHFSDNLRIAKEQLKVHVPLIRKEVEKIQHSKT